MTKLKDGFWKDKGILSDEYVLLAGGGHKALDDFAVSEHDHPLSIATDNGTSLITLLHNTKYKLTAGGKTFIFTTPTHTDQNVSQQQTASSNYRPVVLGYNNNATYNSTTLYTSVTNIVYTTNNFSFRPDIGAMYIAKNLTINDNPNTYQSTYNLHINGTAHTTGTLFGADSVKIIQTISYTTLQSTYGLDSSWTPSTGNLQLFLKAWCKYAQTVASGYVAISYINPNSRGYIIADVYNSGFITQANIDSGGSYTGAELGAPIHITCRYVNHGNTEHIFGYSYGKWYYRTNLDSNNTQLYVGGSGDLTSNAAQTNGAVYLTLNANGTFYKHNIVGGTGVSVTSDANGKITITNTQPDVNHNTDYRVRQIPSTDNYTYELLFSKSADNTQHDEESRKTNTLLYNPSTKLLTNKGPLTISSGVVNITGESSFGEGIRLHHVSGLSSLWFGAVNSTGYDAGMWGITVNSNGMRFRGPSSTTATSSNDYVNILHGGNVGINNTSPTEKLHVLGNIKSYSIYPNTNNTYFLGSDALRWKNLYSYALHTAITDGVNTRGGGDLGVSANPRYFPQIWTFNSGITPTNGDIITIKTPAGGHDYGVFLSMDNGINYYPITLSGTGRMTTHFPSGSYLTLLFDSSNSAGSMFALAGQNNTTRVTISGGTWRVINYYDSGNPGDWNLRQYTIKAAAQINNTHIIGGTDAGYKNVDSSGMTFDIRYPVLWAGSDIASGSTGSNNYIHHYAVNFRNSSNSNISGLTSYKNVYIKGTISGTTFTPISGGNPYVQDITTSDDGYVYYYIGRTYGSNAITFDGTGKDIYVYKNGAVQRWTGLETTKTYTSVDAMPSGADGWYNIFTINDSTYGAAICTIKAYAHSSLTFVVSKGYSTSSTLQILQYNSSSNASFFYVKGVRILSDGKVQALFNKTSGISTNVNVTINIFSSTGNLKPNNTLTLETATLTDSTTPSILRSLNGTHNEITSDLTGNASTSNRWKTARSFKIGNTAKNVDGTADITWTLGEIGASPSNHTHTFAKITTKLTHGNEFNFVDQEQASVWFNYRRASDSAATTETTNFHFGKGTAASAYAYLNAEGYKKRGSSDSYVLLGGGGHKALSDLAPAIHEHKRIQNNYSNRPTTANVSFGDGYLYQFKATSSMTEGKPAWDAHLLHFSWDNTGGYDAQLAIGTAAQGMQYRAQNSGTWGNWIYLLDNNNYHAIYNTTGSTSYIKIKINSTKTWMISFMVRVYQGYNHYDIVFSGYQYGSNHWYKPQAVLASSTTNSIVVYFGYESNNNLFVVITGGSYTGIEILNVTNGFTQITDKLIIKDLFTITNESSLPSTIQKTDSTGTLQAVCNETTGAITIYRPWYRNEVLNFSNLPKMYWANVQVSDTSSTTTTPQFTRIGLGIAIDNSYSIKASAGIHAAGTIISTASPGFANDVAANSWAYMRFKSGTDTEWHVGTNSSTAGILGQAGAFEIRDAKSSYTGIAIRRNTSSYGKLVVTSASGEVTIGLRSGTSGNPQWVFGIIDSNNRFGFYNTVNNAWRANFSPNGYLYLGDGNTAASERLHVKGNIRSYHIYPDASHTYNIGSSSLYWKSAFIMGYGGQIYPSNLYFNHMWNPTSGATQQNWESDFSSVGIRGLGKLYYDGRLGNKIAGMPLAAITVNVTNDGGSTWEDVTSNTSTSVNYNTTDRIMSNFYTSLNIAAGKITENKTDYGTNGTHLASLTGQDGVEVILDFTVENRTGYIDVINMYQRSYLTAGTFSIEYMATGVDTWTTCYTRTIAITSSVDTNRTIYLGQGLYMNGTSTSTTLADNHIRIKKLKFKYLSTAIGTGDNIRYAPLIGNFAVYGRDSVGIGSNATYKYTTGLSRALAQRDIPYFVSVNTRRHSKNSTVDKTNDLYMGSVTIPANVYLSDDYGYTEANVDKRIYLQIGNSTNITGNNAHCSGTIRIFSTGTGYSDYVFDSITSNQFSVFTIRGATSSTQNSAAYTYLDLGNNVAVNTTSAHNEGRIRIYSAGTAYHQIIGTSTNTPYHHYFPNVTGWIATGGDGINSGVGDGTHPIYLSATGILTQCSKALNSNVNTGTANRLAYYSATDTISSASTLVSNGTYISRDAVSSNWNNLNTNAFIRQNTVSGFSPLISMKTSGGHYWTIAHYDSAAYNNDLLIGFLHANNVSGVSGAANRLSEVVSLIPVIDATTETRRAFVTATYSRSTASNGTAATGSATKPIYINEGGNATACTNSLSATVNSGTAYRMAWYNASAQLASANIYTNGTKLAVNSTSEPTETLYVNGDTKVGGDLRVSGNDEYLGTGTGAQVHIQYNNTNKCLDFIFD